MAGLSAGHDQIVLRGSPARRSFAMFYFERGRLLACDAVNRTPEFVAAKRWITQGCVVDAAALADESLPLGAAGG
jgi:3-phenylpropionate/trans-cinnamate dioxygenase ferredoxin reductase subunit